MNPYECYLCKSEDIYSLRKEKFEDKEFYVFECGNCGLVFIDPDLPNNFYEENQMPTSGDTMEDIDIERRFNEYKLIFKNKKILDFGCGSGKFLGKLKNNNITKDLYSLEPNDKHHKWLSENTHLFCKIDNMFDNWFDYITMFHVLEHLEDPITILKQLGEKLNKDGQIIIEVPNHDDALSILYNVSSYRDYMYVPWHYFYYNRFTLKSLIEKAGFKVEFIKQVQRYSLPNHLYWLKTGKPKGHVIWGFLEDNNLNSLYSKKLAELDMCDTLVALISKKEKKNV